MRSPIWGALDFPISQRFGENPAAYAWIKDVNGDPIKGHNGTDLALPDDTELFAPFDCTVLTSGFDEGGYGNFVRLSWRDTDGQLLLAHMRNRFVANGQRIPKGTLLGRSDNTGWSTGPHAHIGYRAPGWQAQRANGYDGWSDPYPALMGLAAGQSEDDVDMATAAQFEGTIRELERQLREMRETLGQRDSRIGYLENDVEKPLRAEVASLKETLGAVAPRIAEMEAALRQAVALAAKRPPRIEVVLPDQSRVAYVPEAA